MCISWREARESCQLITGKGEENVRTVFHLHFNHLSSRKVPLDYIKVSGHGKCHSGNLTINTRFKILISEFLYPLG